jgi:hypothetical protein
MFLYDITDKNTFLNLKEWFEDTGEAYKTKPSMIIGTKLDLEEKRAIIDTNLSLLLPEISKMEKMEQTELSSKENINVEETFNKFTKMLLAEVFPVVKEFINVPEKWETSNHKYFPSSYKQIIFTFLVCLKKVGEKNRFKIPKFVVFEIFKASHHMLIEKLKIDLVDTLRKEKEIQDQKYQETINKTNNSGFCKLN